MNKQPLISVIIPIYNAEKYIYRCVDSVVGQTYKNLEIILVDDGSPDNCGIICDEYSSHDPRIIVIHKQNGGVSDARNAGVAVSTGEYISFVDADDAVSNDYIEYLYTLCAEKHADIASCAFFRSGSEQAHFNEAYVENIQIFNKYEASVSLLSDCYMNLVTAWGKLIKADIVKNNPFPVGHTHEDEATTFKYYYASRRTVIGNKPCYMYYLNPNSITNQEQQKISKDTVWALNHRIEMYIRYGEVRLAQKSAYKLLCYICMHFEKKEDVKDYMIWFEKTYVLSKYLILKHKIKFELIYRIPRRNSNVPST